MSTDDTLSYDVFVSEPIPLNVTGLLPNGEPHMFSLLSSTLIPAGETEPMNEPAEIRLRYNEALDLAEQALALWRGPALADVQYEPFAQPEILRLDELRLAAVENRIEAALGLGRHEQEIVADEVTAISTHRM